MTESYWGHDPTVSCCISNFVIDRITVLFVSLFYCIALLLFNKKGGVCVRQGMRKVQVKGVFDFPFYKIQKKTQFILIYQHNLSVN